MSLTDNLRVEEDGGKRIDKLARHFAEIVFEEHDKKRGLEFYNALDEKTKKYIRRHDYYKIVLKAAQCGRF